MSEETLQAPEQNYGPGNVLRAKREEYEWSVEAVAEALHLSTHSVKAIEADRYEDLPGATYVIGYWRSYARLLGIDIEETIEVNKRNLVIVTAEPSGLDINRAFGHKAKSGGMGGILLLVLLAAFAYYAWQQQFFGLLDGVLGGEEKTTTTQSNLPDAASGTPPISTGKKQEQVLMPIKVEQDEPARALSDSDAASGKATTDTDGTKILGEQSASGLVLKTDEAVRSVPVPQQGNQAGLILAQDSASSDTVSSKNLLQAQTIPKVEVTTQADGSVAATSVSSQTGSQTEEVASGQSTAAQTASGEETMTLTLSKDSWLDIRDKTRTRLLYKTEKAGKSIDVSGIPPFYVYIGTPDGVTIRYRGKDVPFETHKTGMFARFKLDDEMLEAL